MNEAKAMQVMPVSEYLVESARTDAPHYHGDKVRDEDFLAVFRLIREAGERADKLKRSLFYGKDYVPNPNKTKAEEVTTGQDANAIAMRLGAIAGMKSADGGPGFENAVSLIHVILGLSSEVAEMVEAIIDPYLKGGSFDAVNFREEIGDFMWYEAKGMRTLALMTGEPCDFETEGARNIAKLYRRFPEKFTEHHANNRNLSLEREVLEGK